MMGAPCWRNPDVWCDCRGGVERAQCDERFVGEDDAEQYRHDEDFNDGEREDN